MIVMDGRHALLSRWRPAPASMHSALDISLHAPTTAPDSDSSRQSKRAPFQKQFGVSCLVSWSYEGPAVIARCCPLPQTNRIEQRRNAPARRNRCVDCPATKTRPFIVSSRSASRVPFREPFSSRVEECPPTTPGSRKKRKARKFPWRRGLRLSEWLFGMVAWERDR